MATHITVLLTKKDLQILRRLIVEEAKRTGLTSRHPRDPLSSSERALKTVAGKIWDARQAIDAA